MKHLTEFITNASKYPFETPGEASPADGTQAPPQRWLMRQPTPDEAASGDSAYRVTYNVVMKDRRLKDLSKGDKNELEREARIRANAAEAIYMLPLLLETETGKPAFDVADEQSLAEFESLPAAVVVEMTGVYFSVVKLATSEAKKKSPTALSSGSGSPNSLGSGRSPAASKTQRGRKS